MIGYADEDSSFVLELTYNYGVKTYDVGNDFKSITIKSKTAFKAASRVRDMSRMLFLGIHGRNLIYYYYIINLSGK